MYKLFVFLICYAICYIIHRIHGSWDLLVLRYATKLRNTRDKTRAIGLITPFLGPHSCPLFHAFIVGARFLLSFFFIAHTTG
uniref:Uncharacterized protein n=1 Tax=Anopheles darlingi TaxID=43151 RepID=A0A2M4DCQ2_ANODA